MAEYAIDLQHVSKVYKRRVRALDGVTMQVRRGEIFGLLGPNGAGKSTLVKIIMSVVRPTTADGLVLGKKVGSQASLLKVGYLPEHHRFPRYLTGRQTLEFFAALSEVDSPTRRRKASELLEAVGMTRWADARVSSYSKGMMQRVGVAQALVNNPDLVILDEPTDGVDPVGRREIRDVLLKMRAEGRTVFVNSHLLSELEMICDRVAILVAGRVVQQGTIDELTRARQCFIIEVVGDGLYAAARAQQINVGLTDFSPQPPPAPAGNGGAPPAATARGKLASGAEVTLEGNSLRIATTDVAVIQPVIDALRAGGFAIRRIQPARPSLEDLFIEAVGGVEGGHQAGAMIRQPGFPVQQGGRP